MDNWTAKSCQTTVPFARCTGRHRYGGSKVGLPIQAPVYSVTRVTVYVLHPFHRRDLCCCFFLSCIVYVVYIVGRK